MVIQQAECSSCAHRTYTGSPWVGSIKNGAIEIRDRKGQAVVTVQPSEGSDIGSREMALAHLIIASPDLADFAQEFFELFAGDIPTAVARMQEHPERLGELQLLASLGVARMHGTAGVMP